MSHIIKYNYMRIEKVKKLTQEHNIKLLEILYWDFNNIKNILSEQLTQL